MNSETEAYFAASHARRHEARSMQYRTVATKDWKPEASHCHSNVNHRISLNPNLGAVCGWMVIGEDADGCCRFQAHSVIDDAGELYDITLPDELRRPVRY
jgi:hypothetical protein